MKKLKTVFKYLGFLLEIAILLTCSLLFIRNTCYMSVVIEKNSMNPTLQNGDYGYALKTKYALTHLKRFDIVTFNCDYDGDDSDEMLIKRVIGLPNEVVEFTIDGSLYVNSVMINQDFISLDYQKETGIGSYVVPSDCYFVLGDNRKISLDSRSDKIGFVHQNQLTGILKVITATCNADNDEITDIKPKPFVYF